MAKNTQFFCQNCGTNYPKWQGKCNNCNVWNSIIEETIIKPSNSDPNISKIEFLEASKPELVSHIKSKHIDRKKLPGTELNTVLGGGLVEGSLILFGGDPGIGKSTLMLQMSLRLKGTKILYVSGEESKQQIKLRADRINNQNPECYILTTTHIEQVFKSVKKLQPEVLVIDSIQTIQSEEISAAPGSVSQVRVCANKFMKLAKTLNLPTFLIGHITKDGQIAGPKVLEHIVDTVLQFEGDQNHAYRLLKCSKNRFGTTSEIGLYQMKDYGLKEVDESSDLLVRDTESNLSGASISAVIKGNRALLIETQALVTQSNGNYPQRSANGIDQKKLSMLIAVLEKRCNIKLNNKDVFFNISGGLKVSEPSIDLSALASIISSFYDHPIPKTSCFCAEISLTGEVRPVVNIMQRINEADKLGFKQFFYSSRNQPSIDKKKTYKIELVPISKLDELSKTLFK